MNLYHPVVITPRLMAGVKVGEHSWISIQIVGQDRTGRYTIKYYIDTPDFEYECSDMTTRSCVVQKILESLLSFLGAAAEAYRYCMTPGRYSENRDLFPAHIAEWAYLNSSELEMLQLELEQILENSPCKSL